MLVKAPEGMIHSFDNDYGNFCWILRSTYHNLRVRKFIQDASGRLFRRISALQILKDLYLSHFEGRD